jgi:hypothetical protein
MLETNTVESRLYETNLIRRLAIRTKFPYSRTLYHTLYVY